MYIWTFEGSLFIKWIEIKYLINYNYLKHLKKYSHFELWSVFLISMNLQSYLGSVTSSESSDKVPIAERKQNVISLQSSLECSQVSLGKWRHEIKAYLLKLRFL